MRPKNETDNARFVHQSESECGTTLRKRSQSKPPLTYANFVRAYRIAMQSRHAWAMADHAALDDLVARMERAIMEGPAAKHRREWNHRAPEVATAWAAVGGKGFPTWRTLWQVRTMTKDQAAT
jgi:hypothetical protein